MQILSENILVCIANLHTKNTFSGSILNMQNIMPDFINVCLLKIEVKPFWGLDLFKDMCYNCIREGVGNMIEINGRQFCENCFEPITGSVCRACGFNPADSVYDPLTLVPGSVLMNRYVVGRVIGKGCFGITYLAYDALTRKKIAVKEYFPYGLAQRTTGSIEVSVTSENNADTFRLGAEKFYNEAKLVSKFNGNPNIVSVYDCFYENDTVYMAMEYLRGSTLKDYIREHGILSAPQALYIANSITNALVVAHSASVLHRDISPDNVMMCDNGDIKLIDFGAARQLVAERSQAFSVILKPGFAPPEQYSKKGNQGSWTDVYSLGTTLYFMLTGDIPEDPTSRFDDDDTFKENQFDIDPTLWEVITKSTKLKIEERYADSYELKKALSLVPIKPEPPIAQDETSAEGAELPSKSAESAANLTVSIKKPRPKQSFFRRHLRTFIEITCGLLAAAMIIPLAVKVYRPAVNDNNTSSASSASDSSGTIATVNHGADINAIGFGMPIYAVLTDEKKELYANIYQGLVGSERTIVIPSGKYTVSEVKEIHQFILYENPNFAHTQGYNLDFNDLNHNKEPDPEEYVNFIYPIYTGVDPREMDDYLKKIINESEDIRNKEAALLFFHDKLLSETEIIPRNSSPTSSTAYGAIVEHSADEAGIALAMCAYAQRIGLNSYVFEMPGGNGGLHTWTRVKIDGSWYNIFAYMDTLANNDVTQIPIAEDSRLSHKYFLFGDTVFFGNIKPEEMVSDEQFVPLFTSEGGELSKGFYYFEGYLKKPYYSDAAEAYNALLAQTEQQINSKEETVTLYADPLIVNDLWDMIKEKYISDLAGKGIKISEFTGEYTNDYITVTLKK